MVVPRLLATSGDRVVPLSPPAPGLLPFDIGMRNGEVEKPKDTSSPSVTLPRARSSIHLFFIFLCLLTALDKRGPGRAYKHVERRRAGLQQLNLLPRSLTLPAEIGDAKKTSATFRATLPSLAPSPQIFTP